MGRVLAIVYGVACYVIFLASVLYAMGFMDNLAVPKSIDSGPAGPIGAALWINLLLLGAFAVQHSGMARQSFKAWWTRVVPKPVERSTYVLFSSLALILLFWQWRPIPHVVWNIENPAGRAAQWAVSILGWAIVLVSTLVIGHFDLFGLRQAWLYFSRKEYTPVGFRTPLLYKVVRHPIYLGFLLATWAVPAMTAGHLLFLLAATGYIFLGITFEERDLLRYHGEAYALYHRQVSMILPMPRRPAAALKAKGAAR